MKVEINDKIKSIIDEMPYNKTVKKNALKIYAALYILSSRKNKFGYFPVPSVYLMSVNKRYFRIIDYFEEKKLIRAWTRPVIDEDNVFNVIDKKYYNVDRGICMRYKFLIETDGFNIDVDMMTNKHFRWYELIQESLLNIGYEDVKITRDGFGRRVHHSAIREYKNELIGYWTIDAIASQPRLLYLDMREKGIVDTRYNEIFENEEDFYLEIENALNLSDRQSAKDLFMFWVNSRGYVPNFDIHKLFPVASKYIKSYKSGDYKNMGSHLQRTESKIWIDDILNNIPTDWALPVHDCVIVKEEDADRVLNWCERRWSDLKFKKEIIK
jgi:hypothetical protein